VVTVETFLKVMLEAQIKLGKLTTKSLPLALIRRDDVILATWVLNVFRRLLLSISKVATVSRLIPSSVPKKVLLIVTLCALETVAGNVSEDKAGRAVHEIVLAAVKDVNWRVDRRVRLLSVKLPPIELIDELVKLVRRPAFSQITSPVTCSGPSRFTVPEASGPTTMLPVKVEQEANAEASA